MISAVIFDLDGTLCDTAEDLTNAVNHALGIYGYNTWNTTDVRKFIGNGITKLIERSLPEKARTAKKINEVREHFIHYYKAHCVDYTVGYDGISQLLASLQGENIKLSVVTNKSHEQANQITESLFPEISFSAVLGNKPQFLHKPDTALTLKAMEIMQSKPAETVFIGDSGVDIQTAKNANLHSIGVSWGYRDTQELEDFGADFIVDSAKELFFHIKNSFNPHF